MRKNLLSLFALAMMALNLMSCAGIATVGMHAPSGLLYTQITVPANDLEVASESTVKASKVGKSTCTNMLGLISTGDCGIDAAMRSGGITKVQSVDFEYMHILGLIGKKTTVVRGE